MEDERRQPGRLSNTSHQGDPLTRGPPYPGCPNDLHPQPPAFGEWGTQQVTEPCISCFSSGKDPMVGGREAASCPQTTAVKQTSSALGGQILRELLMCGTCFHRLMAQGRRAKLTTESTRSSWGSHQMFCV